MTHYQCFLIHKWWGPMCSFPSGCRGYGVKWSLPSCGDVFCFGLSRQSVGLSWLDSSKAFVRLLMLSSHSFTFFFYFFSVHYIAELSFPFFTSTWKCPLEMPLWYMHKLYVLEFQRHAQFSTSFIRAFHPNSTVIFFHSHWTFGPRGWALQCGCPEGRWVSFNVLLRYWFSFLGTCGEDHGQRMSYTWVNGGLVCLENSTIGIHSLPPPVDDLLLLGIFDSWCRLVALTFLTILAISLLLF